MGKRNSHLYKKIWIEAHGAIPRDENGISYEIHHLNGDRTDNRLSNLVCVSIQEHFDIHFAQGDFKACQLIAGRMNNPNLGKKMSDLYKKKQSEIQKKKVLDGTHHLLSGEIQTKANSDRVKKGTHNFQQQSSIDRIIKQNYEQIKNGTHPLLKREDGSSVGRDVSRKRIKNGTHHFLNPEFHKNKPNQKILYQYDLNGNFIRQYKSVAEAIRVNENFKTTIYDHIYAGTAYKGYIWTYDKQ